MALPKIDLPLYTTEIPSTGRKINFRPFLVKEEKILLMALESGNEEEIHGATLQIIRNCTAGNDPELDVEGMANFDVEWMFLQIRRRSIGDNTTLRFKHKNGMNNKGVPCDNTMKVEVDLSDVEVHGDIKPPIIHLTETVGMKMRYPTVIEAMSIAKDASGGVDKILKVVASCIEIIFDGDEMFPAKNSTEQEINDFLEGLNTEQFQKVNAFFDNMPRLHKKIRHQCKKCDEMIEHNVEGLSSFFV
jgi:hypothetical protein